MPPELMKKLDIQIPTIRRDPHWFVPTTGTLLFCACLHDPWPSQATSTCSSDPIATR